MLLFLYSCVQVRMYCESQPRYAGKSFQELFPDSSFPHETVEDKGRSEEDGKCTERKGGWLIVG